LNTVKQERVIVYIDGYNLYFGLKESGFRRYFWLNIDALCKKILKTNQKLIGIKYFTSLVTNNVSTRLRQKTYINALQTLPIVKIYYGKFQKEQANCNICGSEFLVEREKMTDVNIATQMTIDFYENVFDLAILISGDTDLLPPIRLINDSNTKKRVFVAFPPNRINEEVRKFSKGDWTIGRKNLADSQFPDTVTSLDGERFQKPVTWI
jgi:uncharacterized LabA/DUF88 family protein